jgi:hypothetical protein
LEKNLSAAMAVADSNAADEWQVYEDILKQMDETGVSLFQNTEFLNWAYDHSVDNWDCGFATSMSWDYETSSTLDADGNTVTENVCFTG